MVQGLFSWIILKKNVQKHPNALIFSQITDYNDRPWCERPLSELYCFLVDACSNVSYVCGGLCVSVECIGTSSPTFTDFFRGNMIDCGSCLPKNIEITFVNSRAFDKAFLQALTFLSNIIKLTGLWFYDYFIFLPQIQSFSLVLNFFCHTAALIYRDQRELDVLWTPLKCLKLDSDRLWSEAIQLVLL